MRHLHVVAAVLLVGLARPALSGAQETMVLDGDWAFRMGDDPAWASPSTADGAWTRVPVPGPWEPTVGAYDGFAWYRLRIELSAELAHAPIGIRFGSVGDAFEVYWNGVRVGGRGSLPPRFVEAVPPGIFLVPDSALRRSDGDGHVVAVRVYNDYAYGGLMSRVRVGAYDVLASESSPRAVIIGGLVSFFLAIGIYHFAFWLRRRTAREDLLFSVLCVCVSVYGATYAAAVQEAVMPYTNPYRLGLVVLLAGAPAFVALVNRLFRVPGGVGTRAVSLLFAIAAGMAISLPLRLLAEFNQWIDYLLMAGLAAVVVRAWRASHAVPEHGRILLVGTVAFSGTFIYDLLSEAGVVPVAELLPGLPSLFWLGFMVFVVCVGIATAGEWARTEIAALVDPLTELSRRHVLDDAMRREAERLRRSGGSVALVMIDLDHFKEVNDSHGHRVGDRVLARVGRLIRSSARNLDLTARFGGEEFAVLLYDTELDGAVSFAERFRHHLAQIEVEVEGSGPVRVSASIGVAVAADLVDPDALLDAADDALYRAKLAGRDRVVSMVLDGAARRVVDPADVAA